MFGFSFGSPSGKPLKMFDMDYFVKKPAKITLFLYICKGTGEKQPKPAYRVFLWHKIWLNSGVSVSLCRIGSV